MDLVGMDFLRRELVGCRIFLFLGERPFLIYVCLPFMIPLIGGQKIGVICALVELGVQ